MPLNHHHRGAEEMVAEIADRGAPALGCAAWQGRQEDKFGGSSDGMAAEKRRLTWAVGLLGLSSQEGFRVRRRSGRGGYGL